MANNFTLTLDTTGPANPTVSLNSGAQYATAALITATIGTGDGVTTGYQMKFWGDIDLAWGKANGVLNSSATGTTETDALWITYAASKQLQLAATDGNKTINMKLRDDVLNESSQVSDAITLDTTRPTVTITGPDVNKISKQATKDTSAFTFTSDQDFVEYKVKVVPTAGSAHDTGTLIPTTGGSTSMAATGTWTAGTGVINSTIKGADLETAATGDGAKIVKVFVKDAAGNWSA